MKNKLCLVFVFLLLLLIPQVTSKESEDTTHITIREDGTAFWEFETRFELKNEEDKAFFEEYIEALEEEKEVLIEEKQMGIQETIDKLNLTTNRSMKIENLNLSYGVVETINKDYGVVKFQFLWYGFAEKKENRLLAGDVFLGGYHLAKNETMILEFPQSFIYRQAYPPPDETRSNTLIWYGPRTFGEKEPSLALERFESTDENSPSGTPEKQEERNKGIYLFAALIIVGILIGTFFILIRRNKEKKEYFFSDEEMILSILEQNDGKYLQNDIVKETGFSKSKVSQLLNEMEIKDVISKKKIGRNNLIILNEY
ncbi:MAG: hypothetical protein U9N35_07320 [Euryarchaeota archaeon]|nr:hypothetical protein [Euryarchaeota archaeon]